MDKNNGKYEGEIGGNTQNHKKNAKIGFIAGVISFFLYLLISDVARSDEILILSLVFGGPLGILISFIVGKIPNYDKKKNLLVGTLAGALIGLITVLILISILGPDDGVAGAFVIPGAIVGLIIAMKNNELQTQEQALESEVPKTVTEIGDKVINHKKNAKTGFIIGVISTFIFADVWIFYDFGEAVAAALIIIGPTFAILGYIISRIAKNRNNTANLLVGAFAGAFIIPFIIGLFGGNMDDDAVGALFFTGAVVGIVVAIRNNKLSTQPKVQPNSLVTSTQPEVKTPLEPIAIKSEAFEKATEIAEINHPVSQKPEDNDNTKDHSTIQIKSGFAYKGAAIQYKIKVENPTPEPIGDIKVTLFVPDVFILSESTKSIAMLKPDEAKTVTFDIRPTGECGDCQISGKVVYYDYAGKKTTDAEIPAKNLSIVCPLLHSKEISEDAWRDTRSHFTKAEEGTKDIDMPASTLFDITSDVLRDMNLYMLEPKITDSSELYRAIARFYAEGVKELQYAAQIEVIGGAKKSKLIIKAWAEREEALIGFYHGMLDEIEKRVNVKELIDTPAIQQFYHYGDTIGTQVKDSVVQRSNIGKGVGAGNRLNNCSGCGREVNDNERFCSECGKQHET